eukprot:2912876-Rhodomonas_salina.1
MSTPVTSAEPPEVCKQPLLSQSTPPTSRKRPRRDATERGAERYAHTMKKFEICAEQEDEEAGGDPLPPSDASSGAEIDCKPGMLEVQEVRKGPYEDEKGHRVYLCDVGTMDSDGEWHDGVAWE